jgi:hypothetical protein
MTRDRLSYWGVVGSTVVCTSPTLIAAYHALHRLPVPRHPPYALSSLTEKSFCQKQVADNSVLVLLIDRFHLSKIGTEYLVDSAHNKNLFLQGQETLQYIFFSLWRIPGSSRQLADLKSRNQNLGFRPACLQISFAVILSKIRCLFTGTVFFPLERIECFLPSRTNSKPFFLRYLIKSGRLTDIFS